MDMDLVIIFSFVATIVLIITTGIVVAPIARKLGHFLEEAARERAGRRMRGAADPELSFPELHEILGRLEHRLERMEERQTFVERLLEEEQVPGLGAGSGGAEEGHGA